MTERPAPGRTGPPGGRELYGVSDARRFRRGGIGVVYEAVLQAPHRGFPAGTRVGLKLLTAIDTERFAKILERGEVLRRHPHPRLAHHIESFTGPPVSMEPPEEEDCNLFFSAHAWVDGEPLATAAATASVEQVLGWGADVAAGLDHLHQLPGGMAHRDVHARNVIVEADGRARLIDFDTVLGGDAEDTQLTTLHSGAHLAAGGGRAAAQANDRAMLALLLLRGLAGGDTGAAGVAELAPAAVTRLSALDPRAGDPDLLVASLVDAVARPPSSAAAVVEEARARYAARRRRARTGSATDRALAGLDATTARRSPRRTATAAIAGLALLAGGLTAAWAVARDPDAPLGDTEPRALSAAFRASRVVASGDSTCAIAATDRHAWCWGQVPASLQQDDRPIGLWPSSSPTRVGYDDTAAVDVAIGTDHRCMIDVTGKVWCWGENAFGQLGMGTLDSGTDSLSAPVELPASATEVAAGEDTSCAVLDESNGEGRVWCWGLRIGTAPDADVPDLVLRPLPIAGTNGAHSLVMDDRAACAIVESRALCWGQTGAVGRPVTAATAVRPLPVLDVNGAPLAGVTSISLGDGTGCATSDGTVSCWGWPLWEPDAADERPASPVPGFERAAAVALGESHLCVLTFGGQVACVGRNDKGQLGTADRGWVSRPTPVPGLVQVTQLSVGDDHSCAVDRDQALWCWGSGVDGQLARPDRSASYRPVRVATVRPDPTWSIAPGRLGPLHVGMSADEAEATGLVVAEPPGASCDERWRAAPGMDDAAIWTEFREGDPGDLDSIMVGTPIAEGVAPYETAEGIAPGDSVADLRKAYGDRLETGTFPAEGEPYRAYVLFGTDGALTFNESSEFPGTIGAIVAVKGRTMKDLQPWFGGC